MIQLIFFIFIPLAALFGQDNNGSFHALILGDTLDENIGTSCIPDVYRMHQSLQCISRQLNKSPNVTVLDGERCSAQQVAEWLSNLPVRKNDIIFFHYAGHGKKDRGDSPWPRLSLRWGEISGIAILEAIRKKRPRLAVVLFDCCNVSISKSRAAIDHYLPIVREHLKGLKTLFMKEHGVLVAAAASPGECSAGKTSGHKWGGFFTTGFLLAINKYCVEEKTSWRQIFQFTKRYALRKSDGDQHAFFKVERR